jgi:hypothetical protein
MERLFILSAVSQRAWEGVLAPVEAYRGQQCLLGWDAQLRAFGAMLRRLGVPCLVTPAPELFFTPTALRVAAESAGISVTSLENAIHIRFGGGRFARVLRGMPNFIATAERAWSGVLAPGEHPFRGQNTAPHAFAGLLDLTGEAGPLMRPDGTDIERIAAPRCIIGADLAEMQITPRPLAVADFAGLEIAALAEFGGREAADLQARRLVMAYNAGGPSLVLLPWNLANPASCVPDLAVKTMRALAGTADACQLILLPFNVQRGLAGQMEPLLGGIKRELAAMLPAPADFEPARPVPAGVMIGQVPDFSGVTTLRRMGAVAWVEGVDPEAAWTEARLAACGIPAVRLPAGAEKTMTEVRDEFGQRFFEGRTLAARDVVRTERPTGGVEQDFGFQAGACGEMVGRILAAASAAVA